MRRNYKRPSKYREYIKRHGAGKQPQLNRSIYYVGTHGIAGLDRETLKQIARPIIREANLRLRMIEDAGLETSSPAYQFIKRQLNDGKLSASGKDTNTIKNNLRLAYDFLHTTTSTVEGAKEYSRWLDRAIGTDLTENEKTFIWKLVHKFEDEYPQRYMNYEYDETIKIISTVARNTGFDQQAAEEAIKKILDNDVYSHTENTDFSGVDVWPSRNNSIGGF